MVENKQDACEINGLVYTRIGLILTCIYQSQTRAQVDEAEILLHAAMDDEADVLSPCWDTPEGDRPYYTPLEFMCVMHKLRVKGAWIYGAAARMIARGATLTRSNTDFWSPDMTAYAERICQDAITS